MIIVRLWSITELLEGLEEAGFESVDVRLAESIEGRTEIFLSSRTYRKIAIHGLNPRYDAGTRVIGYPLTP